MFVIGVGEPLDVGFLIFEKIEIPVVSRPSVDYGHEDVSEHVYGEACDCFGSPISFEGGVFFPVFTLGSPSCWLVIGFGSDEPLGQEKQSNPVVSQIHRCDGPVVNGAKGPRSPKDGEVDQCFAADISPSIEFGSTVAGAVGKLLGRKN